MKAVINFYNEKVEIVLPQTFASFKEIISEKYMMNKCDVDQFLFYANDNNAPSIQSQSQYEMLLHSNNVNALEITVHVCETSKLYQDITMKILQEEQSKEEVINEPSQISQSQSKIIAHPCICDGCGMNPIIGIRYKCTVCRDFDFCEGCEVNLSQKHGHPFLKIRKPEFAPIKIKCGIHK